LDEAFERAARPFDARDRAFLRALTATTLRRKGELDRVISVFLTKPLPSSAGLAELILLTGATQLLFMETAPHAAIDLAVTIAANDRDARHFAKVINAVLRKVANEGTAIAAGLDQPRVDTPEWLWRRWQAAYGEEGARGIARAHLEEPPLDFSVKTDAVGWAERLSATILPTGTVRIEHPRGAVNDLPGYTEGAWWVQDAGARLPVLLLGEVAGKRVLDLCAAPGGKTAQLASSGAIVTAVDRSPKRVATLRANLDRLRLEAEIVTADAGALEADRPYDAVLLDAPCSATGTIRRHPDLPYIKDEAQIAKLAAVQARLLDRAAGLVRTGGLLVYCTCSLERGEGEEQIERILERAPGFRRVGVRPEELAGQAQFITEAGDLRTHPGMAIGGATGLDGFFAARLLRE
jgi:16S rRNA (cytosine967-C5)-methyltransferase